MKQHETWWQENLGKETYEFGGKKHQMPTAEEFQSWMGDTDAPDRVFVRTLFGEYESFLDAGCGAAPEYFGMPDKSKYTGLDITPKLVAYNQSRGINCVEGSLEAIPFPDKSFDVSHSRHVVEHMDGITKPLSELIRVTKKRVVIAFFIDPRENKMMCDQIDFKDNLYHNRYSQMKIELILSNHNVRWRWINVNLSSTKSALVIDLDTQS